jgi:hypothetical protein
LLAWHGSDCIAQAELGRKPVSALPYWLYFEAHTISLQPLCNAAKPLRRGCGSYNARIKGGASVRELVRTNDMVLVSAIGALLDGANIHHLVLDQNMSVIEGSVGVLPRRILVHDDDNREARQVLKDAGLAHELRADE